jgi:hypothetical protein
MSSIGFIFALACATPFAALATMRDRMSSA